MGRAIIMAGPNDLAVAVPIEQIKVNVLEISIGYAPNVLLDAVDLANFLPAEAM